MIEEIAKDIAEKQPETLRAALEKLKGDFLESPEFVAQSMGVVSANLVASYVGGKRAGQYAPGYDVVAGEEKIEVKSRLWDVMYARHPAFLVGKNSRNASLIYFLLWYQPLSDGTFKLLKAFRMPVPEMLRRFPLVDDNRYCARVSLRRLEIYSERDASKWRLGRLSR